MAVSVGVAVKVGVTVTVAVIVWVGVIVEVGVAETRGSTSSIGLAGISATCTANGPVVVWLPASSSAATHTR